MEWQFILALVIEITIIIIPAALVWYLKLGWVFSHAREAARKKKVAAEKEVRGVVVTK